MTGFRGYIASRPLMGERAAQHVQNLVVRDYCQRRGLPFLLSATEYAMPGCFLILEQVLDDLAEIEGIVCYSLFMLPARAERRAEIWRRILGAGKSIHFALEGLSVVSDADVARIEDVWLVRGILPHAVDPSAA
jgi:sporadic carbohydrate cluster protein (TIGR04323 family)